MSERVEPDTESAAASRGRPLLGLSLAGFLAFIDSNGGREEFSTQALTTADVKHKIVLPVTAKSRLSFTDLLEQEGSTHVAPATQFISHVYSAPFLKTVDAISAWEARQSVPHGPHLYYFDLLVVNQHSQSSVVPFDVLRDTFAAGVRSVGHTLLCLEWADAVPMRRMWCVFELATTLACGARLEVIMSAHDEAGFHSAFLSDFDSLLRKMCTIDVERATAREAEDEANIRRLVASSSGGFLATNQLVIGALRDWMTSVGLASLTRARTVLATSAAPPDSKSPARDAGKSESVLALTRSVGRLLKLQGRLDEAEPFFIDELDMCRQAYGGADQRTCSAVCDLAAVLKARGKYASAEPLLAEALASCRSELGPTHDTTTRALNSMASFLRTTGRLREAEPLYREALEARIARHGIVHADSLRSLNNLGEVLEDVGASEDAESLYRRAFEGRSALLGPDHPDALWSAMRLAGMLRVRGAFAEAEPLHERTLANYRRALGDSHLDVLTCMHNFGLLMAAMGELTRAEASFSGALAGRIQCLGATHPASKESERRLIALQAAQRDDCG